MQIEKDPLGYVIHWPLLDAWVLLDEQHVCLVWRGKLLVKLRRASRV